MSDYFTADWHLGHTNIIKYCNRPFKTIDEMDAAIINEVNAVAGPNDRVYNLGDVAIRNGNLSAYRSRFTCKNIFVVPGNHDREKELVRHFTVLPQGYMYESDGFRMVLCHYAMRVWAHSHHGAGMLYGHSHDGLPLIPGAPTFDIGIDAVAHHFTPGTYRPLSLIEVKQEMKRLCGLKGDITEHHHHGISA